MYCSKEANNSGNTKIVTLNILSVLERKSKSCEKENNTLFFQHRGTKGELTKEHGTVLMWCVKNRGQVLMVEKNVCSMKIFIHRMLRGRKS